MNRRNPMNGIILTVYWWIGGYVLMAFSPEDQLFVSAITTITGWVLWFYIEGEFRKGRGVDKRLKPMLLFTPAALIVLGVILLIAEIGRQ